MLVKIIRHIRRQPKVRRDNYAMALAGSFTGLIALVWFVSANTLSNAGLLSNNPTKSEETKPFAGMFAEFKNQLASVKDGFGSSYSNPEAVPTEVNPNAANLILTDANKDNILNRQEEVIPTPVPPPIEVMIATTSQTVAADMVATSTATIP